jgi:hypothetical protein
MKNLSKWHSYLIVSLLISVYSEVWSQSQKPPQQQKLSCGTAEPTSADIQSREKKITALKAKMAGKRIAANALTYLPIKAHIVRKSDGTGGLSMTDLY